MNDKKGNAVPGTTMKQRIGSLILAGTMAASMVAPAAAFAANEVDPTVTGSDSRPAETATQTGTGATDITLQLLSGNNAVSGTDDENNPDGDHDGLGDNVAFTVPTQINFVANSDGVLTGPDKSVTYIENESIFDIRTSHAKTAFEAGWAPTTDAAASTSENAIDFQIGVKGADAESTDMLDASTYQGSEKQAVGKAALWNMDYRHADYVKTSDTVAVAGTTYYTESDGAFTAVEGINADDPLPAGTDYYVKNSNIGDRVQLDTQGDVNNITKDLNSRTKAATIVWYVTPHKA